MNELKSEKIYRQNMFGKIFTREVYEKSEADKVIEELEQKLARAQLVLRLNKPEALFSNLDTMCRLSHEKDVVARRERHQRRKRCLAMAEWCKARYDEEDARINGHGASWEYISLKMKYWERWQWRWEELAEEPTWAKFLQLIRKKAK